MSSSSPPSPSQSQFEALLQPHLSLAYNLAFRVLNSREEAEDTVQNAAIRAWKSFDAYTPDTNFKAWFLRIVVNLALNAKRDASRRPVTVEMEDEEAQSGYLFAKTRAAGMHDSQEPATAFMAKMQAQDIQEALAKLPEEFRVVAALHFIQDLSYEEIANVVGCPLGTVRSRLHRARRMLQKELWETATEMGIAPRQEGNKKLKSLVWILFPFLAGAAGTYSH